MHCRNSPITYGENDLLPAEETIHFHQLQGLLTEYLFWIKLSSVISSKQGISFKGITPV